ncbi:sigma 54-interacting transcriptional regulator [Shewanella sp. W3-18-1]|uniref:sigma 54-interacting transcriptional regulator n=1 Tax=Shewanella sp. (strain W3-18-1) TaxID=351745 RepID=UPI00005FDE61|nr:sigma 54-interacting transcriptional regulator [Shewanella sp. W3-18-1]ABM23167.1 sigma-54 factor, interaction domain-containing protein [Shewanella sp. W3-18-1]
MMESSFGGSLNDEVDIMEFRVINFSEEKSPKDLAPYWHQVSLESTQQTVSFTPYISDIISQAVMSEWKQALALIVGSENIKELAKKYSDFMPWVENIAEKGPEAVLQNEHNLFSGLYITDRYDVAQDRNFVSQARAILARKTVFLLPDSSPSNSVLHRADERNVFIRSFSALLSAGNTSIALAKSGYKTSGDSSIFNAVLASLFARNSQLRLDEDTGIHIKPGPLLIEGDTGTGKSAAAKHLSMKMGKTMVEINLAAVSETLLETRMRGSSIGAFTGATNKKGFFEEADNGVLFLDELQSANLASQTQLLDLLSAISNDVWISKVGDDAAKKKFNVKVVLAVNEPVSRLLAEGRLRPDLFHRIRDVVKFKSLNELFAQENGQAFLTQILTFYRWKSLELPAFSTDGKAKQVLSQIFIIYEDGVLEKIMRAPWPGNFRQLERFAWDLFFVLGESVVVTNDLIERLLREENSRIPSAFIEAVPIQSEQTVSKIFSEVETIIKKHHFNMAAARQELGIYNLKSPPALRGFILRNKEQFSEGFLADSAITKIFTEAALERKTGAE